jgi:hypothetical protein
MHVFSYREGAWVEIAKTGLNWCNEDRFVERVQTLESGMFLLEGEQKGEKEGEVLTRFDTIRFNP